MTPDTPAPPVRIDAHLIVQLLRHKHQDDVCIPECKAGSSMGATFTRMDFWAMRKSWANPCVHGYEIKVTRGDFLQDQKWMRYLPMCNEFSFVCPRGVIQKEELPDNVGLYYVAANGSRIMVQRKPVFRDIVIPEDLWRYILMNRVSIIGDPDERLKHSGERGAEAARAWVAQKEDRRQLGHFVNEKIHGIMGKMQLEVLNTRRDMEALRQKMTTYDRFIATLQANGLDPEALKPWVLEARINELTQLVSPATTRWLTDSASYMLKLRDELAKFTGQPPKPPVVKLP